MQGAKPGPPQHKLMRFFTDFTNRLYINSIKGHRRSPKFEMGFLDRSTRSRGKKNLLSVVVSFNHVNHGEKLLPAGKHEPTCG